MVQTPSVNDTFFGLDISGSRKAFISFRRKISKRFLLIEFGVDYLNYGEARIFKDQVFCSKLNQIPIDKSAIERGTPTDTEVMASFLSQIIEEDQIWGHRVAITLPPQAALSKIIYLPKNLNYNEAIDHIINPSSSGFQFPISIENTDFDLIPLNFLPVNKKNQTKPYFLSSVPKKLVDNIIKTLSDANLELHSLDVAYSSLERLARTTINKLKKNQVYVLIELSLECTHLYILSLGGPIYITTLAAIRAFEVNENYKGNTSLEENTINSDDYSEISALDLKVLLNEVQDELITFKRNFSLEISEIILSGINSSHKGITNFFRDRLKIKTSVLRAISSEDIGDLNVSKPILMQDFNRIIGLGLSIIQTDEDTYKSSNRNSNERKENKIVQDKTNNQSNNSKEDLNIQNRSNILETTDIKNRDNGYSNSLINNKNDYISDDSGKTKAVSNDSISFQDFLNQNIEENKITSKNSNQISSNSTFLNSKNNDSSLDFSSNLQTDPKLNSIKNDEFQTFNDDKNDYKINKLKKDPYNLDSKSQSNKKLDLKLDSQNIDDDDDDDFNMP